MVDAYRILNLSIAQLNKTPSFNFKELVDSQKEFNE